MHILLIADGRSPITKRWIETALALGHRVSLISTFQCDPLENIERLVIFPVGFSQFAAGHQQPDKSTGQEPPRTRSRLLTTSKSSLLKYRNLLGPLTVRAAAPRYKQIVRTFQPDIVHALRIPFEGMLASFTPAEIPLAVSIWGNDLTLHAPSSRGMANLTRRALMRADGLLTDVFRDQRLAREWGFSKDRPAEVVPGNGGIDLAALRPEPLPVVLDGRLPKNVPLVINPRGIRAYARTDTFFQSIPLVHEHHLHVAFACPGMLEHPQALIWIQRLGLDERTVLLPGLPQGQLWELFARSIASVSVTTHDGTPNTLLEAMACGSFPIAGDIESLREWITPGENGLLVDPGSPTGLAEAIIQVLDHPELRSSAADKNKRVIAERAEVSVVRPKISAFYQLLG